MTSKDPPAPPSPKPCPICSKPASTATRPFCSRRCADIDLHRWLGGRYVVPSTEAEPDPDGLRDEED